jgi:hypothetical protein
LASVEKNWNAEFEAVKNYFRAEEQKHKIWTEIGLDEYVLFGSKDKILKVRTWLRYQYSKSIDEEKHNNLLRYIPGWSGKKQLFKSITKVTYQQIDEYFSDLQIFISDDISLNLKSLEEFKAYFFNNSILIILHDKNYYLLKLIDKRIKYIVNGRLFKIGKKITLEEISEAYGITRERIRQLELSFTNSLLEAGININSIQSKISKKNASNLSNKSLDIITNIYDETGSLKIHSSKNMSARTVTLLKTRINKIFNNYILNIKSLTKMELLIAERVIKDSGGEEKFFSFNCPVTIKEKTYIQLIDDFIYIHKSIPRTRSVKKRGYEERLAIKIAHWKDKKNRPEYINKKFKEWDIELNSKTDIDRDIFYNNLSRLEKFVNINKRWPRDNCQIKDENFLSGFRRSKAQQIAAGYIPYFKNDFNQMLTKLESIIGHTVQIRWTDSELKSLFNYISKNYLKDPTCMPSRMTTKKYGKYYDDRFKFKSIISAVTSKQVAGENLISWTQIGKKFGFQKIEIGNDENEKSYVYDIDTAIEYNLE